MRKTGLLLASVGLAVLLVSGVALAAVINGTNGDDTLEGTDKRDVIKGLDGGDVIRGLDGPDEIRVDAPDTTDDDPDYARGGPGNDSILGGDRDGGPYVGRGDLLVGGEGVDVLRGRSGQNEMHGGPVTIACTEGLVMTTMACMATKATTACSALNAATLYSAARATTP